MSATLDRTERRIIGVLIEKELSVPDLYPLTELALLAGCNQKSNREPLMELRDFELQGALMALRINQWISKNERDGGRAVRYRHEVGKKLGVEAKEKAVLAELLLRGPQTPTELRARVGRMGFEGSVEAVQSVLEALRSKPGGPLVELLPRAPRERDARWTHLLAANDETPSGTVPARPGESWRTEQVPAAPAPRAAPALSASTTSASGRPPAAAEASFSVDAYLKQASEDRQRIRDLVARVEKLESLVVPPKAAAEDRQQGPQALASGRGGDLAVRVEKLESLVSGLSHELRYLETQLKLRQTVAVPERGGPAIRPEREATGEPFKGESP